MHDAFRMEPENAGISSTRLYTAKHFKALARLRGLSTGGLRGIIETRLVVKTWGTKARIYQKLVS
jgi:hypothetical protein